MAKHDPPSCRRPRRVARHTRTVPGREPRQLLLASGAIAPNEATLPVPSRRACQKSYESWRLLVHYDHRAV
ncbi:MULTISPECIES: hypothetical protein [Dietzia]|uniref:Uncharacterized protein n=1 Tax=Dietzia cinnamea TaxID=321318 RepID=A0ABV3YE65_9ACTN|nr:MULTISPECIES: hypothetical protein [Dietzia]MCT1639933.1 hypothetical protein [Dietzia cinnamea]MCT1885058.1 hypothetical protein [Dietzia cinnamea]MCT2033673.1 hypothetical protein [Dietzia cinnamea]MCT2063417.1 hypothetical protein [Dietzia cinnamea]MCT2098943.1 hypothetical protein [Dietzia cinnamea]